MKFALILAIALLYIGCFFIDAKIYKGSANLGKLVKLDYEANTEDNIIRFKAIAKRYNPEKPMSRWFGLGVSPKAKGQGPGMAHASITVIHFPANTSDAVLTSYTGKDKNTKPGDAALRTGYVLNPDDCSLDVDAIAVSFSRPITKPAGTPESEVFYEIKEKVKSHLIWAFVDGTNDLAFHGKDFSIGNVGSVEIELLQDNEPGEDNIWTTIFEWAHGLCMITSWLVLATAGTYIGRYHRRSLRKEPGIRGCLCWYVTHHVFLMIGSVILTFLGFIFILIRQATYLPSDQIFDVWTKPHTMLGFAIIISVLFQVLLGALAGWLFNERKKSIFAKFHWFVGRALWISGFINVYLGMGLVGAHTSSYMIYYLWTAAVIGLFVFTTPEVESPVRDYEGGEKQPLSSNFL